MIELAGDGTSDNSGAFGRREFRWDNHDSRAGSPLKPLPIHPLDILLRDQSKRRGE